MLKSLFQVLFLFTILFIYYIYIYKCRNLHSVFLWAIFLLIFPYNMLFDYYYIDSLYLIIAPTIFLGHFGGWQKLCTNWILSQLISHLLASKITTDRWLGTTHSKKTQQQNCNNKQTLSAQQYYITVLVFHYLLLQTSFSVQPI